MGWSVVSSLIVTIPKCALCLGRISFSLSGLSRWRYCGRSWNPLDGSKTDVLFVSSASYAPASALVARWFRLIALDSSCFACDASCEESALGLLHVKRPAKGSIQHRGTLRLGGDRVQHAGLESGETNGAALSCGPQSHKTAAEKRTRTCHCDSWRRTFALQCPREGYWGPLTSWALATAGERRLTP